MFASRLHGLLDDRRAARRLDAALCHASVVSAATRPPSPAVYRPCRNSPVLQRNRPYRYTTPQFCCLSGPNGWSVRYDRYGSIYTTIYLHDIYSDAHTVDTSIYTAKLINLCNTSIHVDSSETFSRLFVRSAGLPIRRQSRDPRVNFKTIYGAICGQSHHVTSRLSDATKRDARVSSLAVLYRSCSRSTTIFMCQFD